MTRRAACAALLAVLLPMPARAQAPDAVTVVPAIYSSDTMTRNADLSLAGAVLATAAVDKAIAAAWSPRPESAASRTARISKLLLFDVPVVTFLSGLNHEGGHIARTRQQALPYAFDIVGTPWSARPFELVALDPRIFDDLGSQTGGLEASRTLKDRGEALLWRAGRAAPGLALATVVASLDLPVYAWHNLSGDLFTSNDDRNGDPVRILEIVARRNGITSRGGLEHLRSGMRRRAAWNLADTALWSLAYGLVRDYAWAGEPGVTVRWLRLGGVRLLPGVRYEWTPAGAEYSVRSHYRAAAIAGKGYVRWTERLAGERQAGAGGSVAWRPRDWLTPRIDVDAWSHTRDGAGVHGAVSAEIARWAPAASAFYVGAGTKSAGHLGGLPADAGAYVSAGMLVRLW